MYFQTSDFKKKYFLNLNNNDYQLIHPIYSKSSTWLKHFSLSNSLCTHITRLITNHTPIGKYRLRFFPNKLFAYLYSNSPIKDILTFLEFNPGVFCFQKDIKQHQLYTDLVFLPSIVLYLLQFSFSFYLSNYIV